MNDETHKTICFEEEEGDPDACNHRCAKSPTGFHVADATTIRGADGFGPGDALMVDIWCQHCGSSGSVEIDEDDIDW